ncbi:hypothetical protein [Methanosarcina horonobensis]|uniref:hypothetical protein n=1 Tax=Methanosarcina horonobensis TaxID=418008 RepID=UPI000B285897|nr:hypothetical protein [Methanosarcina horonobensis]
MNAEFEAVLSYHQASKHGFKAYAPGPRFLEMEIKPDPFLNYKGVPVLKLDTWSEEDIKSELFPAYEQAFCPEKLGPSGLSRSSISQLFLTALLSRYGRKQEVRSGLFVSILQAETSTRQRFTLFPIRFQIFWKNLLSVITLLCRMPLN